MKHERTFVMIKPDGVQRGLTGEIIQRIEQRGLKVVACALIQPTRAQGDMHYPKDKKWITRIGEKTMNTYQKYGIDPIQALGTENTEKIGRMVREWIVNYITSGPTVKMIIEGPHAIDIMRKICGSTIPLNAELGSIRGDFSADSPAIANSAKRAVWNIIHASETTEEAQHEIKLWFKHTEIHPYLCQEEKVDNSCR